MRPTFQSLSLPSSPPKPGIPKEDLVLELHRVGVLQAYGASRGTGAHWDVLPGWASVSLVDNPIVNQICLKTEFTLLWPSSLLPVYLLGTPLHCCIVLPEGDRWQRSQRKGASKEAAVLGHLGLHGSGSLPACCSSGPTWLGGCTPNLKPIWPCLDFSPACRMAHILSFAGVCGMFHYIHCAQLSMWSWDLNCLNKPGSEKQNKQKGPDSIFTCACRTPTDLGAVSGSCMALSESRIETEYAFKSDIRFKIWISL